MKTLLCAKSLARFSMISSICVLVLGWGATVDGQQASEIYLFDIQTSENGMELVRPRNISRHPGYDNQPHFHPDKPLLFYSSFNDDGRSDIRVYQLETDKTDSLTNTTEREYSPTVTPDGRFVSCIIQRDDGAQDLGKYPIGGGKPTVLINDLIVGKRMRGEGCCFVWIQR